MICSGRFIASFSFPKSLMEYVGAFASGCIFARFRDGVVSRSCGRIFYGLNSGLRAEGI